MSLLISYTNFVIITFENVITNNIFCDFNVLNYKKYNLLFLDKLV